MIIDWFRTRLNGRTMGAAIERADYAKQVAGMAMNIEGRCRVKNAFE